MKHYYQMFLLAVLTMTGCSQENAESDSKEELRNAENGIVMKAKPFETENITRTSLDENLNVSWTQGDLVGVFGESGGQQVRLDMTNGGSTTTATFTSEDFQLKKNGKYVAYYPLVDKATAKPNIAVTYEGQTQAGNSSVAHLAAYDYMVASATATETNTATFEFSHTAAILKLNITMPEAGKWSAVTLSADDEKAFTTSATLNLLETDLIAATEQANSTTLTLVGANNEGYIETTAADEVLTVWMMLSPTDYFNATDAKNMTVTVKSATEGKDATFEITPCKSFVSGKYYVLDVAAASELQRIDGTFKVGDSQYVTFAKGNLQYNLSTKKYQLAENQWTYCVTSNGTYTLDSDKKYITATPYTDTNILDLFGWGTANAPTYAYVNLSTTGNALNAGNYYLGAYDEVGNPKEDIETDLTAFNTNNDWGTIAAKQISGLTGARTLTAQEWKYLLQNQYCAVASLTDKNVLGLVVFPYGTDETTAKSYLTTASPTVYKLSGSNVTITQNVTKQSITVENLTAAGALFLPAGGSQMNGKATDVKTNGYYWSASSAKTYGESAYVLQFLYNNIKLNNYIQRRHGCSVRLAMSVDAPN